MLQTLRNRLILSHILPLLILIPVMGVTLVYALETQILFPQLKDSLVGEVGLLAELTHDHAELWEDSIYAQSALDRLQKNPATRVMLISPDGQLIASTNPEDQPRVNQPLQIPGLSEAQKGQLVEQTVFSQGFQGQVFDVLSPVYSNQNELVGIIRMSYHFESIPEELLSLRYLIATILFAALLLGSLLGLVLAVNISNPMRKVTKTIYDLARGDRRDLLPESGPEEVRTLVQAINYLNGRLHNMEQARRHLLANLVHELGRPLGAIHSGLQALSRGAKQDPELMDDLLEGMDEEVSRLQHLLDDLAHLHDQVLGTLELDRQSMALSEWLSKTLLPWQQAAREKRLQWETSIPLDLPVIKADPDRLAQILGNLLSNAIKYTPAGGNVSVSAGEDKDGMVWVQVSDSGPGIPIEEQEEVFEPFYRGSQKQRIKQGLGLGLSIARELVTAHGGQIEVESSPGLGSKFILRIPKDESEMR